MINTKHYILRDATNILASSTNKVELLKNIIKQGCMSNSFILDEVERVETVVKSESISEALLPFLDITNVSSKSAKVEPKQSTEFIVETNTSIEKPKSSNTIVKPVKRRRKKVIEPADILKPETDIMKHIENIDKEEEVSNEVDKKEEIDTTLPKGVKEVDLFSNTTGIPQDDDDFNIDKELEEVTDKQELDDDFFNS